MSEKKPRVIAFYKEHPTLNAMADKILAHAEQANGQLDFLTKRYREIQSQAQKESAELQKALGAEIDRLGIAPDEKFEGKHFHLDFDTKTIQRCDGRHGLDLAAILGFSV